MTKGQASIGDVINALRLLLRSKELGTFGTMLAFLAWVFGIAYCDRVALEKGYNIWLARAVGVFLPILGPAFYWYRKNKRHRRRHRHAYRPVTNWHAPSAPARRPPPPPGDNLKV